jgi:DNA-binding GntR family transcriptional regulator
MKRIPIALAIQSSKQAGKPAKITDTTDAGKADAGKADAGKLEPSEAVNRPPLRDDARVQLLQRIVNGELQPGSRINESQLSLELGLSRTPLREALMTLEREGFVRSEVNRGFIVAEPSSHEAREIYPILWTLEGLALRETGLLAGTILPELERINREFSAANLEATRAIELDTAFHDALISRCPNRRLLELVRSHRQLLQRYEHIQLEDSSLIPHSVAQHAIIIQSLRLNDLNTAVAALEQNWRFGFELLLLKLKS